MAAKKENPKPEHKTMDAESAKLRGRVVDELQSRIQHLKNSNKAVPKLWHDKLSCIAETDNALLVEAAHTWMVKELPPKEYHAAEITWATYADFANELVNALSMYIARQSIIGDEPDSVKLAAELVKQIFDVRDSHVDSASGMAELAKIRTRVLTELKRFRVEA